VGSARTKTQIDLPAALDASAARDLAELQLLQRWRGLNGYKASLPMSANSVSAGSQLSLGNASTPLRIVEVEHQRGTTRVTAREWATGVPLNSVADPGRNLPGSDLPVGETRLILADLPAFGTEDPGRAKVVAAAAGTGAGWKRAALSMVDGDRIVDLGVTKGVATIGELLVGLPPHSPMLEDQMNQPVIRLLHDAMSLPTGSGDPKSFDAPSIWLNGEIVRYGNAAKIGPREYQLNGLLRGCFGTDSSVVHPAQADVFLIESESLLPLDSMPTPIGAVLNVEAQGIGDAAPVAPSVLVTGGAVVPWRLVHGTIERLENGDIFLKWQRRDRLAHNWADGADVPNSEGVLAFIVELYVGGVQRATWDTSTDSLLIMVSEIGSFSIAPGAILQFQIRQQGRFAQSKALTVEFIFPL
jgi:hypothetical protein